MRLAEFKMRLLVFFAGALRRWAGVIEPTADEPARRDYREDRFEDGGAALPAESRREGTGSGPPEHWARLVATAPPDHWLDLIRAKAPHLLSPEGELVAGENESAATDGDALDGPLGGPPGGALETDPVRRFDAFAASNSATDERSMPQPRSRGSSQRPADSIPPVSAAKWLNRLHFRPPKRRPAHVERPGYPDSQATTSAAHRATSPDDRAAAGTEIRTPSDRYEQGRKLTTGHQRDRDATSEAARRVSYWNDELNETVERRSHREIRTTGASPHGPVTAAGQDNLRDDLQIQTSAATSEAPPLKTVEAGRQPRSSKAVSSILVERAETNSTRAPSRSKRELTGDSPNSQDAKLAEAREDERLSSRAFSALSAERPTGASRNALGSEQEPSLARETQLRNVRRVAVEQSREMTTATDASARVPAQSNSADSLTKRTTANAAAREAEPARHRFASTDFRAPALNESSESMWPSLPPSRNFETNFELGDELAALEREVENLRRLDREQRGTAWNA